MNIYVLESKRSISWDETDLVVVIADSGREARHVATHPKANDRMLGANYEDFADPKLTSICKIGTAQPSAKAAIIAVQGRDG